MNSIVFSPIECLSLSLSEKKHHQQPDAVRAVVDAVAAAPDKNLAPLLENFTWTFEKVTHSRERNKRS